MSLQDNTIDELRQASPTGGVFDAQKKPSRKVIDALEEFQREEAETEWQEEAADAMVKYFYNEVRE